MKRLIFLITLCLLLVFGTNVLAGSVWRTNIADVNVQRATGSAALANTLAPAVAFKLLEVRIHLSSASATAENFTITMDAGGGAAYDAVLDTQDMNGVADYVVTFTDRYFTGSDELDFAWANTNTRTYGLEIVYQTFK